MYVCVYVCVYVVYIKINLRTVAVSLFEGSLYSIYVCNMSFKNEYLLKKVAIAVGWGVNFFFKNSDEVLNFLETLSWSIKLFNILKNSNQPQYTALKMTNP